LATLLGQLRPPPFGDPVVLALTIPGCRVPARGDVAEPLEPVEQRGEQARGPVQLAARDLVDLLEDRVPVTLSGGKDAQHHRRRRRRDQVFRDVHCLTYPRSTM